ncbi:hypothetical protein C8A05DRAFT_19522 [Staphylotrichum tortipilum]|uniref:Uncharacterized protein n=1 Tax=Staphylotrichum tortipilum TaxID=2831512 RepID=A0AAN6MCX6_9PEZI|nr:hypothetical protein C8A05DRAFT_19522 [Staphylotrichum longicolle]
MSALTYRSALVARRRLATTPLLPTLTRAAFTTSSPHAQSAINAATDALHSVDRKVSDKLVDGINISTTYTAKLKEVASDVASGKVTGQAAALRANEELKGKARGVKEDAKGKASEVGKEAEGVWKEVEGKAREVAGEVKGKARGLKEEVEGRVKGGW